VISFERAPRSSDEVLGCRERLLGCRPRTVISNDEDSLQAGMRP
jgi:hypothetical protein